MITEIDLREVLARSVGAPLSDLVTRSTGAKVRSSIEAELSGRPAGAGVVLDFSSVRVLDCSCADEVVAKLVLGRGVAPGAGQWFVIRGLGEGQAEEIDHVLRRRRLAMVAEERDGHARLLGEVEPSAEAAWRVVGELGNAGAEEVATVLRLALAEARQALQAAADAGVVRQADDRFLPLTAA